MRRRSEGKETWNRLIQWDRNNTSAERLTAQILKIEGYESIDPSHPLGGPDGLKDMLCKRYEKIYIVGVYFPRGQKSISEIRNKFKHDLKGIEVNDSGGFIFVTNQELRLSERSELEKMDINIEINIYHLERLSSILDNPAFYGIRLEYLDIEMTKEEQISFITARDIALLRIETKQKEIFEMMKELHSKKESNIKHLTHQPYCVVPKTTYSEISASLYGETVHRCSNCGFGYLIESQSSKGLTYYIGSLFDQRTITCPNCGNVEEYTGL